MPNPKRQHSKGRSRRRRTHQKLEVSSSAESAVVSKAGYLHSICPVTGCYKGRQVIEIKTKAPKAK